MQVMINEQAKIKYKGSFLVLIFWAIFLFPVAAVLILSQSEFTLDAKTYSVLYDGSIGWLCFWSVVCFPIAIALAVVNGFSVKVNSRD